eukprot:COSAG02_NODE_296_length_25401_cov_7.672437_16_plen_68_part_00
MELACSTPTWPGRLPVYGTVAYARCQSGTMVFAIVVDRKGRSTEMSRVALEIPYYFPRVLFAEITLV